MGEYFLGKDFLDMISLFCSSAIGQPFRPENPVNIREVLRISREQGVWEFVFFALDKACWDKECGTPVDGSTPKIPKDIYNEMLKSFFVKSAHQIRRQSILNKLYDTFEKSQIKYCILKGESLSHLYYYPSLRISSDVDIYIDKRDIKDVIDILVGLDYEILSSSPDSHHLVANHPIVGKVEIHLKLLSDFVEKIWFDDKALISEGYQKVKTSEGRLIPTLGVTDHLVYITLHFIKHFLNKGIGIRQLMDILLYMKFYRENIDWDRYKHLLDCLKYKKFVHQLMGIGICYFGINPDYLPECRYDKELMNRILWDMQTGGIFGKNEYGRKELYEIYTRIRLERFRKDSAGVKNTSENDKSTLSIYIRHFLVNRLRMLIPGRESLADEFSYLNIFPFLYPVALMQRIIRFCIRVGRGERRITQYVFRTKDPVLKEVFNRRIEMVKKLEMI